MIGVQLQGHFTEENISYKFISELKKKNPKWDKITIACEYCTTLLSVENNDGFNVSIDPKRTQLSISNYLQNHLSYLY